MCSSLLESSHVKCDIGIVSQAGNWKYLNFEEPESVKIKHIHRAKNKGYVLIGHYVQTSSILSGHQAKFSLSLL